MPGHYIVAKADHVHVHRYSDLDFAADTNVHPERLAGILREATQRHLMSDVPLGIFLSGGVDSAGIVALAQQSNQKLKTLTISFSESEFNEAAEARRLAEHFKTEHHELQVRSVDFAAELPKILAAMDQPTNDGVNTYFVARAARKAGLTVVLSGLGGDELFLGYPHYHWIARNQKRLGALASAPAFLRRACVGSAVALGRLRGKESWMRLDALRSGLAPESLYLAFRGFFASEQAQGLLGNSHAEMSMLFEEALEQLRPPKTKSSPSDFNGIEFRRYLHDQLLRDTDVFGMAHSIEVRVPYLADQVVALALDYPAA